MPGSVYDKNVIEFVTVAADLCVRLEKAAENDTRSFVASMLKILPLLYVKAQLVAADIEDAEGDVEEPVTEEDYDFVRRSVARVMGAYDDYLDVFVEDMKYSDRPILKTVSEDLADIYQDLRNFIEVYREGYEETMEVALARLMEGFSTYWGLRLVCVVRPLHDCLFHVDKDSLYED